MTFRISKSRIKAPSSWHREADFSGRNFNDRYHAEFSFRFNSVRRDVM